MDDILGLDPQTTLQEILYATYPRSTRKQIESHILNLVKNHPINGSNAITLLKFSGQFIVLIGEIHENELLCKQPRYDVLKHIVLKALREHTKAILLVEGFVETVTDHVPTLKKQIREQRFKEFVKCLQADDFRCQYYRQDGNLLLLRVLKWIVHASRCLYPRNKCIQSMDDRIQFFDVRKDLGMKDPFVRWASVPSRDKYIRQSLAKIDHLGKFLSPIPKAAWQREFQRNILGPTLETATRLKARPSVKGYTDFFILLPDVVAVNQILCRTAGAQNNLIMVYAGDNHRKGVLGLLRRIQGAALDILAESQDPADGSCSRPLAMPP
jgi:hypothetical protein